jgi:hypothetical protein
MAKKELQQEEMTLAATLIQVVFRHYRWKRTRFQIEDELSRMLTEQEFCNKMMQTTLRFRDCRK